MDNALTAVGRELLSENVRDLTSLIALRRRRMFELATQHGTGTTEYLIALLTEMPEEVCDPGDPVVRILGLQCETLAGMEAELRKKTRMLNLLSGDRSPQLNIEKARQVPIADLIDVNRMGFAKCVWHTEKTASMKVYDKDNRVYCYGCNRGGDAIDVAMATTGKEFSEVVRMLTSW